MDIEREMAAYAGMDYANPRRVEVATLDVFDFDDINDLIDALIAFREEHSDLDIETNIERSWGEDRAYAEFTAHRIETAEETNSRIGGYRTYVMQKVARRRSEYERMKREFGDA